MTTVLNPYINFRGQARDAMTFYQSVLGGELTVSTYAEMGGEMAEVEESDKDKVMHSQLETPSGFTLMASDIPSHMPQADPTAFSVSLSGDAEEELTGYWLKLSDGAEVTMPLSKAPWGDSFGMLTDKFGISWLVNISGVPQE